MSRVGCEDGQDGIRHGWKAGRGKLPEACDATLRAAGCITALIQWLSAFLNPEVLLGARREIIRRRSLLQIEQLYFDLFYLNFL